MSKEYQSAIGGETITPSDTVNLSRVCRCVWVGTTGNVAVVFENDTVVTFPNVPVGLLHVEAKRINSTNTTASDLVAMH